MNLRIDRKDSVPVYEQIRQQIVELVRAGLLKAGSKLPSVRDLAKHLGISVKTVRRAYDELGAEKIIETQRGSGTYITAQPQVVTGENLRTLEEMGGSLSELPPMSWEPFSFKSEFFHMPRSKRHAGETIRFTLARPDPALFPFAQIKQVATNMLWNPQQFFFDYGHAQGFQPLVEHLEREMALAGVPMAEGENEIIVTGGFQRALALVLDMILKPGQKVAVEAPTYNGVLTLLLAKDIDAVACPVDSRGMDTDHLADVLAKGEVRAIITTPTYHNPTGATMAHGRREQLIRLAARHRVPIIEDDWGRLLRYEGEATPPLKAMDPGGYVIHIGTFSKCFMPGLRIGWLTVPSKLAIPLLRAKFGMDVGDSFFLQALLHEFITKGHFTKHVRRSVKEYKRRCDAMCRALKEHLPPGCNFSSPAGGFTIWVKLPSGIMSLPLLSIAREAGVEFLPAAFCMPDRSDTNALRLSFSCNTAVEINQGIRILGNVIKHCIHNPDILEEGAKSYEDLFR